MKILAVSGYIGDRSKKIDSAVHLWRIKRPMRELAKHVDWQIDIEPDLVQDIEAMAKDPDTYIREHGDEEVRRLGQYDIIFSSYFTSPHLYTLLWAVEKHYGTRVVLDIDDDVYDVDTSNFNFWMTAGRAGHEFLTTIAQISPRICTTTPQLADKLRQRSEVGADIYQIPNYITDDYRDTEVDNGDKVVVGFFGGASHFLDLHDSRVLPAIQKLMHRHKNVHFKLCGQPLDFYLPKGRTRDAATGAGTKWHDETLPGLKLDIALGPLLDTEFNRHKSNIKWQEATRMGSAFVASNSETYRNIPDGCAVLVNNTVDEWYEALESLVLDAKKRKNMVKKAKQSLLHWRLEDNWPKYRAMFEAIAQ